MTGQFKSPGDEPPATTTLRAESQHQGRCGPWKEPGYTDAHWLLEWHFDGVLSRPERIKDSTGYRNEGVFRLGATKFAAADYDNRWGAPQQCPRGLVCHEETMLSRISDKVKVPTRLRVMYDPKRCSSSRPCQPLFEIGGGGDCTDRFPADDILKFWADKNYLVVGVFPHCEKTPEFSWAVHEVAQLEETAEFIRSPRSAARSKIAPNAPNYATGSSHGAVLVSLWHFKGKKHPPTKTFARSAIFDGLDLLLDFYPRLGRGDAAIAKQQAQESMTVVGRTMSPKELFQWNSRHMVVNFRDPKSVAAVKAIAQKSQFGASFGTRRKNLAGCFEYTKGFPHSTRKFAELLLEANPDSSAFFEVDQNPCMHGIGTPSENPAEWRCLSDFFSKGAALACPQKQIVTQ